jgi:hypothetical protein
MLACARERGFLFACYMHCQIALEVQIWYSRVFASAECLCNPWRFLTNAA